MKQKYIERFNPGVEKLKAEHQDFLFEFDAGKEFDETICGIPSVEIKMFAVDKKYQNVFYEHEEECLPISAWILRKVVNNCINMITNIIGFKALFLHSVPSAETFYLKNGFHNIEEYMLPLYSVDEEFQAMYMSLKNVHINQDM